MSRSSRASFSALGNGLRGTTNLAVIAQYAPLLAAELTGLGAVETKPVRGGIRFQGSLELAYRACLWLRTASRSLVVPFALKSTVSVPVSKLAESVSLAVAVASMLVAGSFSA